MQKIEGQGPEACSADTIKKLIGELKRLTPEIFVEDKIDLDVFRQLIGDSIDDREEKYGINWPGKRRARQSTLIPSNGTLRPAPTESVDWESTKNILIEGDNLEVLKLLQKSYHAQVKLIYIDPPYNTGNEFIYPDDYTESLSTYLQYTGQVDTEGRRFSTNTESSGRFHSKWLSMMYPRLKLARNLLTHDGAIFVSIADHEVHNLRMIMNEIYGEENFVAAVIWQKMFSPKNSARHFSEDHDYVLVYAKNSDVWAPKLLPRSEEMEARYSNPDNDPRGKWTSGDLCARNYYSAGTYSLTCPSGRVIDGPPSGSYWRVSKPKLEELDRDNRIWWGSDGNNMPRLKRFISEVQPGRVPQTLWPFEEVGHTQEAKKELLAAVKFPNSDTVLETPKPTRLIKRMLQLATSNNGSDIVLDFFAGSGSTFDATLAQNSEDNGNRRCILVQLPEPLAGAEPGSSLQTIIDITKARLNSAGKKIRAEKPLLTNDVGFRVFKLDGSNIKTWDPDGENLAKSLLDSIEHLKPGRSETDVLFELLLKWGLELTVQIEQKTIADKRVYSVGAGSLLVCLAPIVESGEVEELAMGIISWHKDLKPAGESTCVFQDHAFANDVVKANLTAILQQHGLENVRSL